MSAVQGSSAVLSQSESLFSTFAFSPLQCCAGLWWSLPFCDVGQPQLCLSHHPSADLGRLHSFRLFLPHSFPACGHTTEMVVLQLLQFPKAC